MDRSQIYLLKRVTGEYKRGDEDEINRRKRDWEMCMSGNDAQNRSYFNLELEKIAYDFPKELGIQYTGRSYAFKEEVRMKLDTETHSLGYMWKDKRIP